MLKDNEISVEEGFLLSQKGTLLIDVREFDEVQQTAYNCPNVKHIPLNEVLSKHNEIPKDEVVIVACRSGKRSLIAVESLEKLGFTQLKSLHGGIIAWQNHQQNL